MNFREFFQNQKIILTEGSIIELLKRKYDIKWDANILNASMLLDDNNKIKLEEIYREYINIGREYDLPLLILTPTWRTNPERLKLACIEEDFDINAAAVKFLQEIRSSFGLYAEKIRIGALMGVKNDAYKPEEALGVDEAADFHNWQIQKLAAAEPDFFIVSTIPSRTEAIGMAKSLSMSGVEYILSFVVDDEGCLLDGNRIEDVIDEIDNTVENAPLTYMINCVHPDKFNSSMIRISNESTVKLSKISGLQANTSSLSPHELDNLEFLDSMPDSEFGEKMTELTKYKNCKILGGCCGTGPEHIRSLAKLISKLD